MGRQHEYSRPALIALALTIATIVVCMLRFWAASHAGGLEMKIGEVLIAPILYFYAILDKSHSVLPESAALTIAFVLEYLAWLAIVLLLRPSTWRFLSSRP